MNISLGYVVVWVPDVEQTVSFYESAFGLTRRRVEQHGPITWGEMETGGTTLAFASQNETEMLFPDGVYLNNPKSDPAAIALSLVTPDVEGTYRRAITAGATKRDEPKVQPWGQTVARVRDLNGVLVSMASPRST